MAMPHAVRLQARLSQELCGRGQTPPEAVSHALDRLLPADPQEAALLASVAESRQWRVSLAGSPPAMTACSPAVTSLASLRCSARLEVVGEDANTAHDLHPGPRSWSFGLRIF